MGFSGSDSVAQGWVGTYYVSRFNTFDNEDWFPYPVSSQNEMQFSVDGGIDNSECQDIFFQVPQIVYIYIMSQNCDLFLDRCLDKIYMISFLKYQMPYKSS